MKRKVIVAWICGLLATSAAFSQVRTGDNIVISDPVDDDLYIAGGTITINSPVRGDLIVAGGTITVNDSIRQDLLVAGGTIVINGPVGDDIRSAGGVITLADRVAGDVVVTGGRIHLDENSVVGGDLYAGGGEVIVDGVITGNLRSGAGDFIINGAVEGDLDSRGGKVTVNGSIGGKSTLAAQTLELGTKALFKDDVRYWSGKQSVDFTNALQDGHANFDSTLALKTGKWHYLGFASFLMVLWYLGTALVMIIVIEYLFSATLRNAANTVKAVSLRSLGFGFLFLIGLPVLIVILFVTIIGFPLAILLLMAYVTLLVLATVIVSLLISHWINNTYYHTSWGMGRIIIAAFAIFIFLKLASLTPVVGPLIMLLLIGMGFGGILLNVKWRKNKSLALT